MATVDPSLDVVLVARQADLPGGLHVFRALPQARRRMVGPFIFVDQMGPMVAPRASEIVVLPHPHIGLATVTYLFEGTGVHRDSLGTVQPILPGEVNWMTAGNGIVHSERMRPSPSGRMFGVQTWVALPRAVEDAAPAFEHYDAGAVSTLTMDAVQVRVIAGSLYGATSGVRVSSPLFYAEVRMPPLTSLPVRPEYDERALFVIEGAVSLGVTTLRAGELAVLARGHEVRLRTDGEARLLLLGGEPLDGPRYIYWNFVASSKERLREAAEDWRARRFPAVPDETEFIPLPEHDGGFVNYP